jgi:hypothetical protein
MEHLALLLERIEILYSIFCLGTKGVMVQGAGAKTSRMRGGGWG